jgi:hypothetical protein
MITNVLVLQEIDGMEKGGDLWQTPSLDLLHALKGWALWQTPSPQSVLVYRPADGDNQVIRIVAVDRKRFSVV